MISNFFGPGGVSIARRNNVVKTSKSINNSSAGEDSKNPASGEAIEVDQYYRQDVAVDGGNDSSMEHKNSRTGIEDLSMSQHSRNDVLGSMKTIGSRRS